MRPRNATWRAVTESNTYYVPMAEVFWQISRSRMLVFNIEDLRPCGQSTRVFDRMQVSSLATDCN